jgi:hypothetical protein
MARESPDRSQELDREIERYREAAILAVDQLEWCVKFLRRARKPQIARALQRNRAQIIERAQLFR